MDRRRRSLLGAACLAPFVAARAEDPVKVMTPFGYQADFLEMMNAVAGGHFARAGLAVQLLAGTGAASAMQQLIAGQVRFARNAGLDTLRLAAQGQPVVSIATLYQTGYWFVISRRDRPVTAAGQLRGKTVGIVSVKGTTESYLDLMLLRSGVPAAEVRREAVGNNPGAFGLIEKGRIDAFIASGGVLAALRAQKAPIESFDCDRYASIPAQCYLTTRTVIEREPERVRQFVRAMRASVEEMLTADYAGILERAARDFEITGTRNLDELRLAHELAKSSWLAAGRDALLRNDPAQWRSAARALAEAGIADLRNVESAYTNEFVDRLRAG